MFGGKCPFGHKPSDPFKAKREAGPVARYEFQGEQIPMILRHAEVRQAAKDWRTYSSDAPFRVPIPSEEEARSMRQLPIETNPPEHSEYRAIVEPFFNRPKLPEMIAQVEHLIDSLLRDAIAGDTTEIVHGFALPIQARALTDLLDTGAHSVLRVTQVETDAQGRSLERERLIFVNRSCGSAASSCSTHFTTQVSNW